MYSKLSRIGENAINSEASALAQYNGEIANLSLQRGTILEEHGVVFQEELYGSVGPFGVCPDQPYSRTDYTNCQCYPGSAAVRSMTPRYAEADQGRAAEESFELESILNRGTKRRNLDDDEVDADRDRDDDIEDDESDSKTEPDTRRPGFLPPPNQSREPTNKKPTERLRNQPIESPPSSMDNLKKSLRDLLNLRPKP